MSALLVMFNFLESGCFHRNFLLLREHFLRTLPWANRLRELHAAVGEVCGPEIGDLGPGGVSGFDPLRST